MTRVPCNKNPYYCWRVVCQLSDKCQGETLMPIDENAALRDWKDGITPEKSEADKWADIWADYDNVYVPGDTKSNNDERFNKHLLARAFILARETLAIQNQQLKDNPRCALCARCGHHIDEHFGGDCSHPDPNKGYCDCEQFLTQETTCVCGDSTSLGVVHRTDGPCFVYTAPDDGGWMPATGTNYPDTGEYVLVLGTTARPPYNFPGYHVAYIDNYGESLQWLTATGSKVINVTRWHRIPQDKAA